MEETLDIQQQVPQQEDPPRKKLWGLMRKKELYTKSYEDFESQFSTPEKIDKLHKFLSDKQLYTKPTQDFKTQFFSDKQEPAPSKKKVGTVTFGETYSSPELDSETPSTSEIPTVVDYGDGEPLPNNIVDLSRKATEYSKKTKEIERTDMRGNPIPETIPDESFIGTSKKIIEDLDKQGIKKDFVDAVSELPDEAFNDPNTSKDKLVELYKTNRIKFHQFVNEQKNRIAIKRGAFENQKNANNGIDDIDPNQMAIHVANKYLGTYEEAHPQNLNQLQNIISKKQDIIEHSLIGEERTKALDRVRESYSSYINPTNPDIQAEYEQSPLKNKVDITQYSALKTLQLFDAKKYEQAVNILNTDIQKQYTFKPEFENFQSPVAASPSVTTSDSTLAAKNKGSLSSETIDQQIGKESVLRQLTELGRNNLVTQINSQQYDLEQAFNNTDNAEEKEAIKQQYVLNQGKLAEVSKNASQDKIKFPLTSKLEFDNQVKELVQDAGMGAIEYGTNKFAHGVGIGGESFEDMAVSIFGSEKDKALLGMKRIGESKWFESKTYLPEDYRSTGSPFIMQPSPVLKDAAKEIMGGKKLSDLSADQKQKLTELVANNQSQIETVTNPKAGKSKNFFSKATLYSNTGFIGEVGAFMYKIMGAKSLGLSGKSAELLTLYNDGYSASYTEKLKEGASAEEANQYGVLHGGVMLLAGTVSSKFDAVKDMLAASKSPISKQILGLGEAGWDAIVNKNKSTISKIANGVSDVVKSNAKMIGTYGVGVSIASDLADKGFFNKDISVSEMADNVKHSAIDMAIGSVGLAGIGFISHAIKNPVTLKDKATIWEIGDNKEFSKQRIDEAVAKNELTQAEGDAKKKVIDNVAYLIDKVPTENSKGKLLTDNEKVKLLYNLILKEKGKEAAKDLPDNQSDKAEHIALVADYANGIILENPTEKQLESRKNTLEKQIEGKDENGKPLLPEKELLKAKAQLEAVNNAIEHKQSFDQSVKLEKRDFRKPQGNPEEISQPIELSVEPTVKEEAPTVSDVSSGVKPNWDYEGEGDALSGKDGQLAYTQRLLPDWNRESQKGNINPDSKVTYDIVRGRFGGQDNKDVVEAKDENGVTVGLIKLSSNGGIEHLVVAPEFRKKGIATELYNRLKNENPSVDISKTKQRTKDFADWANKLKSETAETQKTEAGEPPIVPLGTPKGESDGSIGGITQAANAVRRQSLNEPEFQKNPQSFAEWTNEAERLLKEGYDVEALMDRLQKDPDATPVENAIRKIYIATLDAEIARNPTDALLAKQKRFAEIGDVVNREAGQKLVSLKGQGNPLSTISDLYVAKMEANNTDILTDVQKAEVQKDYAELKAARDKAEALAKEATAKFEEQKAENELLRKQLEAKGKKTEKIFTNGKRDFGAEIKNYKDELKKLVGDYKSAGQKLGIASDGGGESFVISAKMAKVIMKIAQVHVEQVGVKIAEVTKRTWEEVKDLFDGITENDIRDVFAGKYNEKKLTQPEIKAQMRELQTESKLLVEYDNLMKGGEPKSESKKQKRNERLTEIREKIEALKEDKGIGKYSDESKVAAAEKAAQKNIEELEDKIANNDLEFDKIEKPTSPQLDAYREKQKALRKELEQKRKEAKVGKYSDESIARRLIASNKRKQAEFERQLREGNFEKKKQPESLYDSYEFRNKNPKLYKELLDSQNAAHEKQIEVEGKLLEEEMKHWKNADWVRHIVTKSSGTLKQVFAGFDASAIAVQNLPLIINNPLIGGIGIKQSGKALLSQKEFDRSITELHNSSDWNVIKECIRVTEPKSLLDTKREEFYPDRFKAIVKIKGKTYGYVKIGEGKYELLDITKPFERQFTALGNWLRVIKFRTEAEKLYEKGFTWEKNPEEFKTLGKRINNLSSSADIPAAYQNELTRTMIWSTRLLAAKLNMLGISDVAAYLPFTGVKKGYYKGLGVKGQKISRQQWAAIKDLGKFASGVMAATYLYAMARGGTVNTNVNSNGFLDVEYGDGKSANFTGGFSRYISLLFQLYNGGRTDKSGVFNPYENKGTDRLKEVVNFVRGKAPPMTASGMNLIAGKNMANQQTDAATEAAKYKMPLALGQIKDQIDRDGYSSLFKEGLITFIGFNTKDQREYIDQDITIPEIKYMADKGVKIMPYKKESLKPLDSEGKPIEVTDEKYDEFIKKREEYIKKDVRDLMEGKKHIQETDTEEATTDDGRSVQVPKWSILEKSEVDKITTDELKGFVMTATTRANKRAIHDLFQGRGNATKDSGKRKIQ